MSSNPPVTNDTPAGLVPLPNDTVERDFKLSEGYTAFSAKLLRLALLGVAAIPFLLGQLDSGTKESPSPIRTHLSALEPWLYLALTGFGICSAAALGHRYCANDGLACHVKYLRMHLKGQSEKVNDERDSRDRRLKSSALLLAIAAGSLAAGVIFLSIAFARAIHLLST
jgi:hypothetical protein